MAAFGSQWGSATPTHTMSVALVTHIVCRPVGLFREAGHHTTPTRSKVSNQDYCQENTGDTVKCNAAESCMVVIFENS